MGHGFSFDSDIHKFAAVLHDLQISFVVRPFLIYRHVLVDVKPSGVSDAGRLVVSMGQLYEAARLILAFLLHEANSEKVRVFRCRPILAYAHSVWLAAQVAIIAPDVCQGQFQQIDCEVQAQGNELERRYQFNRIGSLRFVIQLLLD